MARRGVRWKELPDSKKPAQKKSKKKRRNRIKREPFQVTNGVPWFHVDGSADFPSVSGRKGEPWGIYLDRLSHGKKE